MFEMKSKQVTSKSFEMAFTKVGDASVVFHRHRTIDSHINVIDTFADNWALIQGKFEPGQVELFARGQKIVGRNEDLLVLPPGSVIEWSVKPGPVEMIALASVLPWPAHLPARPYILRDNQFHNGQSISEILSMLEKPGVLVDVFHSNTSNPYAIRLHKTLLSEYRLNRSLDEYAEAFEISKEALIRYFTACFGLSPIKMRLSMRMNRAFTELMLQKNSPAGVSTGVGFENISYFYRQFRKSTGLTPASLLSVKGSRTRILDKD